MTLLFISLPIFWFSSFVINERYRLSKGVEEFTAQTFNKQVFKESKEILLLSEFIEKNKIALVNENCLELPKDLVQLNQELSNKPVIDSLKILLKKIKNKHILKYKFCKPQFYQQSNRILSTEISLNSERKTSSMCEIKHYIYNNKIVRTSSNPENIYEYNDLEKDTFFIGTFRYSIRIRPHSL